MYMIGKNENFNIYKQYRNVILEDVNSDRIKNLLTKVKSSSLDSQTKYDLIDFLLNDTPSSNSASTQPQQAQKEKSGLERWQDAIWDKRIEDVKKPTDLDSGLKQRMDFGEMMRDPSKRPHVLSDRADAIEKDYESKVDALKEKYKNIKPEFNDSISQKYMYTRHKDEELFYSSLDGMRAGDRRQWDLMVKGETANGLYSNDVGVVGHPDLNNEQTAKQTMKKILKMDDAYFSNNKRQLYFLLGLTDDKSGSFSNYNSDSVSDESSDSDGTTDYNKNPEEYKPNTDNPFQGDIDLKGKNPYDDDSDEMNFSNINKVGKFKDFKQNFSNINNI